MKYTDGKCSICHGAGYVTHVNLPVYGSEGVDLCEACLGTVCNMVNALAATALRAHRNAEVRTREEFAAERRVLEFEANQGQP